MTEREIILDRATIDQLLEIIDSDRGFVKSERIPDSLAVQLRDVGKHEQLLIVNTAAAVVWVKQEPRPDMIQLVQKTSGGYMARCTFK
jgi:hypothetical protein